MEKRIPFPGVFWVANIIEVLERFAYYGIYMGMGIYMKNQLGLSMTELGNIQSYFLLVSYMVPVISGTFADKFGFKKVLIVSYLAYLPSILLLLITKTYSGMALTMLSIGLAAGIFKPLVSGTVRAVTDKTNATRGFGIFYAMVNVGGSFGPLVAGALRAIHWNYAFIAAAIAIVVMLLVTIFFFKEPEREKTEMSLGAKLREIGSTLADVKFSFFLIILGLFFWLPFWGFFNVIAMYVDMSLDTARLYQQLKGVIPDFLLNLISHQDKSSGTGPGGTWRIIGETIAHTGYIIIILQYFIARVFEKFKALPSFIFGLFVAAIGCVFIALANIGSPAWIFLGILLFAVGEMISSPRIQEYITFIAPKEKAGLYMGSNFLAVCIGGFLAGKIYTPLYGTFKDAGNPHYIWYIAGAHLILGIVVFLLFIRIAGEFKQQEK